MKHPFLPYSVQWKMRVSHSSHWLPTFTMRLLDPTSWGKNPNICEKKATPKTEGTGYPQQKHLKMDVGILSVPFWMAHFQGLCVSFREGIHPVLVMQTTYCKQFPNRFPFKSSYGMPWPPNVESESHGGLQSKEFWEKSFWFTKKGLNTTRCPLKRP